MGEIKSRPGFVASGDFLLVTSHFAPYLASFSHANPPIFMSSRP
jgi:hypothetical protein